DLEGDLFGRVGTEVEARGAVQPALQPGGRGRVQALHETFAAALRTQDADVRNGGSGEHRQVLPVHFEAAEHEYRRIDPVQGHGAFQVITATAQDFHLRHGRPCTARIHDGHLPAQDGCDAAER